MTIENWLTLIGIVASAGLGYFVKYLLDKRAQFSTKNAEIKREMYQDYVNLIIDFFDNTKPTKSTNKVLQEVYSFYKQYVLYASPKVINAFSDLMQYFYKNTTEKNSKMDMKETRVLLKKMTKVFKEMRKDIGLSNHGLGEYGERLFRAIINDYDETIDPKSIKTALSLTKAHEAAQAQDSSAGKQKDAEIQERAKPQNKVSNHSKKKRKRKK